MKRSHSVRLTAMCWATRSAPIASTSSLVGFQRVERVRERGRHADGRVDGVQAVATFGLAGIDFVDDTEPRRLQHGRHRAVHDRRAIAQPVFEARAGASLARHANGRAAVVVAPVGPVARQRRRAQALVGVDGGRADSRQRPVVREQPADGVLGQRREPVVCLVVIDDVVAVVGCGTRS